MFPVTLLTVVEATVPYSEGNAPSFGWMALQMILALALVCGLAWLILNWGVRKFAGVGARLSWVQVHERAALEPKKALYVVEVAKKFYLLGSAEAGLSMLAELDSDAAHAELVKRRSSPTSLGNDSATTTRSFAQLLRRFDKRPPSIPPPSERTDVKDEGRAE